MRFLLDEKMSPLVADLLVVACHEAVHVRDVGLQRAADEAVMARAAKDGRVVISADTDFGQLLAVAGATRPSVLLLRRKRDRRAASQAGLIVANLPQVADDLDEGAIVMLEEVDQVAAPVDADRRLQDEPVICCLDADELC